MARSKIGWDKHVSVGGVDDINATSAKSKPALVPHPLPVISCPVPIRRQIGLNHPPNQPTNQPICWSNPPSIPQIWYQATLICARFDPTSEYIGFHDFESAPYRRSPFWGFTIGAANNPKMFAVIENGKLMEAIEDWSPFLLPEQSRRLWIEVWIDWNLEFVTVDSPPTTYWDQYHLLFRLFRF